MSLDKKTIAKVARLSALEMSEDDLDQAAPKLNSVMGLIEQLSEVDTDNVEPLANVANIELALRKDEITDGGAPEKVLKNAPEETQGFFVVPKVVEQED